MRKKTNLNRWRVMVVLLLVLVGNASGSGTASNPTPEDGADDVSKTPTLSWTPGLWVQVVHGHQVYLGTSWSEVNDANYSDMTGIFKGNQDANEYHPVELTLGETYYWRIDEVNEAHPNSPWKGDVWEFEVTGYATNPSPYDGEVDVPFLGQSLSWTAGTEALSHDVYFGTSFAEVNDANWTSPEYKANQAVGNTNYALPGLVAGEIYYWRIDERSAVHPSGLHGATWGFRVGQFLIVDNFDSYANTFPELLDVWDDYWVNWSDGEIFLNTDPNFVRDGNSARLWYYNTTTQAGKYIGSWFDVQDMTEVQVGSDWTVGGVEALVLYFYGDPCNAQVIPVQGGPGGGPMWDAAALWVELEDTSSNVGCVLHLTPSLVGVDAWHEWNVDLSIFDDACGVSLANIDRFTIGIGGLKAGQTAPMSGPGQIWVDDIRLYIPRCMPEMTGIDVLRGLGDIGGGEEGAQDCSTDYLDLKIMADEWLTVGVKADIVDDDNVNFIDYVIIGNNWLEELPLWP